MKRKLIGIFTFVVAVSAVVSAVEAPWFSTNGSILEKQLPSRIKAPKEIKTKVISFDGKKDFLPTKEKSEVPAKFTLMAWIRPEQQLLNGIIFCKPGWHSRFFVSKSGKLTFTFFDTAKKHHYFSSFERVQLHKWQQAAVVYDGQSICLYLNGENVLGKIYKGTMFSAVNNYIIGAIAPAADAKNRFTGQMNDIRIWKTALTGAEIAELFAAEKGQYAL